MSIPDQVKGSPSSIVTVMFLETFFCLSLISKILFSNIISLTCCPFFLPSLIQPAAVREHEQGTSPLKPLGFFL